MIIIGALVGGTITIIWTCKLIAWMWRRLGAAVTILLLAAAVLYFNTLGRQYEVDCRTNLGEHSWIVKSGGCNKLTLDDLF